MSYSKKKLIEISKKITNRSSLTPFEIEEILSFEKVEKELAIVSLLKKSAVPLALTVGFAIAVFPERAEILVKTLPSWTNLPTPVVNGADYFWNILSEPVGKSNIIFHLPNIILYSFGVLGIKKLFEAIDRRTWVDRVNIAKGILRKSTEEGTLFLKLKKERPPLQPKIEHLNCLWCKIYSMCKICLLYTSPSPRDRTRSRMPSSA